jgi:hypothetical protein
MRILVRALERQYELRSECFARGVKFSKALARADHYLGELFMDIDQAPEELESDQLDAIGAMLEAQKAIGETECLTPVMKQPFIQELRTAIDAIKGKEIGEENFQIAERAVTRAQLVEIK